MRFFHLADLHFGKSIHGLPLAEREQREWAQTLLDMVERYRPDSIVIAGDVYDRSLPSKEAVELLSWLLTRLAERKIPVLMIAGNHDSGPRLAFANELLEREGVHIAGKVQRTMESVTLKDEFGPVTFWLMPYLFPAAVRDVLPEREGIDNYDQAVRALLAEQTVDFSGRNVLIAHQFVVSGGEEPEKGGSETTVGGVGQVDASAFDGFDYVALGHIHRTQKVGRENVRYAGSPLQYDFSETGRWKGLTLVELGPKGQVQVQLLDVPLPYELRREKGTLDELLEREVSQTDYVQAVLTDERMPAGAVERLRTVYGERLLDVTRQLPERERLETTGGSQEVRKQTLEQLFASFYQEQTGELLDQSLLELAEQAAEQQSRHGEAYINKEESVPDKEIEELIALALAQTEEALV